MESVRLRKIQKPPVNPTKSDFSQKSGSGNNYWDEVIKRFGQRRCYSQAVGTKRWKKIWRDGDNSKLRTWLRERIVSNRTGWKRKSQEVFQIVIRNSIRVKVNAIPGGGIAEKNCKWKPVAIPTLWKCWDA